MEHEVLHVRKLQLFLLEKLLERGLDAETAGKIATRTATKMDLSIQRYIQDPVGFVEGKS